MTIRDIPIELVQRNPDQPRKEFDETKLQELADSIHQHGLMQPISVTPRDDGFMIVAGERRYRAHLLIDAPTIRAIVDEQDEKQVDTMAIIENLQRQDITPIEQAQAYRRMMELYGYDHCALADLIGMSQPRRIADRLQLLKVNAHYHSLIDTGQISITDAYEISRLEPGQQDTLVRMMATGKIATGVEVKAAADGLENATAVMEMFEMELTVTKDERRKAARFEDRIEKVAATLRASFNDENEVTAVRKVDPTNATKMADLLAVMRSDILRLEKALRSAAATQKTMFELTDTHQPEAK